MSSKEDCGEYRHSDASAHGNYEGIRGEVINESSHGEHSGRSVGGRSARPSRPPSVGSDCSIDRSPPRKLARMLSENGDYDISMHHSSRGSVESEELPQMVPPKSSSQSQLNKEDSGEYRHSAAPGHGNYERTRGTIVNESSHGGYGSLSDGGGSAEPSRSPSVGNGSAELSTSPSVGSDRSIDWNPLPKVCLHRKRADLSMVKYRGTNPVSEDSPPSSNISHQSNKDAKAKGGCLPLPFSWFKKKRT